VSAIAVELEAGDGWPIGAILRTPDAGPAGPGVVTVPGSRHERDAWTQVASQLVGRGVSVLQIDIRGRGASRRGTAFADMAPAARRRVRLDVAAAVDHLSQRSEVDADRLGLLVEQDTAPDALEAIADDPRVRALGLPSIHDPMRSAAAIAARCPAVYALVSSEDRRGLRATVDGFLASDHPACQIDVFRGLGVGVTMASVMQFEAPEQVQLDVRIATWFERTLAE
jgi:hypothetical protein